MAKLQVFKVKQLFACAGKCRLKQYLKRCPVSTSFKMGDRDVKLARLLETIGEGADLDFAREVLIANNWDLQAAVAVILGDGVPVAAAPVPVPSDAAAAAATAPTGLEHTASNDVRAPMRTGFHEALLTPDAAEQARQDKAREEERLRVEAEKIAAEERRQREMEEAHKKNLARLAEEQRAAAERQAIERKKQKVQEEQEALRKGKEKKGRRRDDDSDEDLEDIPVDPGIMLSDLSNQLAKDDVKGPAETPSAREDVNHGSVGVSAGPVEKPVEEVPVSSPEAPVSAPKAPALAPTQGEEASPKVTKEEEAPHEEKADSFVSALRALRKKYREAEPAALAACFRTLNDLMRNVIDHPQDSKYQRIKAEKFRSRVGNLEEAIAVVEACGFHPDASKEFMTMDPDYARTQGLRLRENKRKVELLLSELENAGF